MNILRSPCRSMLLLVTFVASVPAVAQSDDHLVFLANLAKVSAAQLSEPSVAIADAIGVPLEVDAPIFEGDRARRFRVTGHSEVQQLVVVPIGADRLELTVLFTPVSCVSLKALEHVWGVPPRRWYTPVHVIQRNGGYVKFAQDIWLFSLEPLDSRLRWVTVRLAEPGECVREMVVNSQRDPSAPPGIRPGAP